MLIGTFFFRKMFANEGTLGFDGFYAQIQSVADSSVFQNGFGFKDGAQLALNHSIRFFSVFPFYWFWSNSLEWFEPFLIFIYSMPALVTIAGGFKFRYGIILLFPIFISPRAYLAAISILCLFNSIHLDRPKNWIVIYSMLLANLSSGVTLAWIGIVFLYRKIFFKKYKWLKKMIIVIGVLFIFSLIHKYQFVSGGTTNAASDDGMVALIQRNIFFDSIESGRYDRLVAYIFILIFCLSFVLYNYFFRKLSRPWVLSLLPIFPLFFFEGLGVMSYSALLFCLVVGMRKKIEQWYRI